MPKDGNTSAVAAATDSGYPEAFGTYVRIYERTYAQDVAAYAGRCADGTTTHAVDAYYTLASLEDATYGPGTSEGNYARYSASYAA